MHEVFPPRLEASIRLFTEEDTRQNTDCSHVLSTIARIAVVHVGQHHERTNARALVSCHLSYVPCQVRRTSSISPIEHVTCAPSCVISVLTAVIVTM